MEYRPQWFEGFTELTLGLVSITIVLHRPKYAACSCADNLCLFDMQEKSVMYFNDGSAEIVLPHRNKDVSLRSDQCWRLFGVKPFEDPSDLEAAKG